MILSECRFVFSQWKVFWIHEKRGWLKMQLARWNAQGLCIQMHIPYNINVHHGQRCSFQCLRFIIFICKYVTTYWPNDDEIFENLTRTLLPWWNRSLHHFHITCTIWDIGFLKGSHLIKQAVLFPWKNRKRFDKYVKRNRTYLVYFTDQRLQ